MTGIQAEQRMPGAGLSTGKMPGHWLLARMGKRVLRPGGIGLTYRMLQALKIAAQDDVVEFAPGMGITARLTLKQNPRSYTAIEQNEDASKMVQRYLRPPEQRCVTGHAGASGLTGAAASVVYGEAMLTMQTAERKQQIVQEAYRILRPAGRYGMHEMCLVSDQIDAATRQEIERTFSDSIHVSARLLTGSEWRHLLEEAGFAVETEQLVPMELLEPGRMLQDEGVVRTLRFVWNLLADAEARRRVLTMRRIFRRYRRHIAAIMLVSRKPA